MRSCLQLVPVLAAPSAPPGATMTAIEEGPAPGEILELDTASFAVQRKSRG